MTPPFTRVFVYGTLMRGEVNHRLLEPAVFVRAARTRPQFRMVSLGGCPAIFAGGTTAIDGELFDVDAERLAALDRLEGHPRFYQRTEIELVGRGRAHAYLLQTRMRFGGEDEIVSGCWRSWCAERANEGSR